MVKYTVEASDFDRRLTITALGDVVNRVNVGGTEDANDYLAGFAQAAWERGWRPEGDWADLNEPPPVEPLLTVYEMVKFMHDNLKPKETDP